MVHEVWMVGQKYELGIGMNTSLNGTNALVGPAICAAPNRSHDDVSPKLQSHWPEEYDWVD